MGTMSAATVAGIIATTFALTPALAYAALGELIGQRSGICNLGVEGEMLVGASCGFAVAIITGSSAFGILAGAAAGCAMNLVFGGFVLLGRTNQLATGFAFYFLGYALSSSIGTQYIGSSPSGLPSWLPAGLSSLPAPWSSIFDQEALVWMVIPVTVAVWWVLTRSRFGLHLRSVGEDKMAAFAAGLNPRRLQFQALAIAGALSGLAGADLAVDYAKTWGDGIVNGRGFIAICVVMLALWRPFRAILGALLFSFVFALGFQLQASGWSISPEVLDMLPYLVTLLVVLVWARPTRYSSPQGLRDVFSGTSK